MQTLPKYGEVRADGFVFRANVKKVRADGSVLCYEQWLSAEAWARMREKNRVTALARWNASAELRAKRTKRLAEIKNDPIRGAEFRRKACASSLAYYHASPTVKERQRARTRTPLYRAYIKNRRANDLAFRLTENLRRRLRTAVSGKQKSDRTLNLLGCSVEVLKQHIEKQFLPGMTWKNYGQHGWHIDHKKPCALFDLLDPKQQAICFNYQNLQPLWAVDNHKKGARYAE